MTQAHNPNAIGAVVPVWAGGTGGGPPPPPVVLDPNSVLGRQGAGVVGPVDLPSNSVLARAGGNLTALTLPANTLLGFSSAVGALSALTQNQVLHILQAWTSVSQTYATTPTNNAAPGGAGWPGAVVALLVTTPAENEITGLDASAVATAPFVPMKLLVNNSPPRRFILRNEDVRSIAANRFNFGTGAGTVSYFLRPDESVWVWYDTTISRWRVIGNDAPALRIDSTILTANTTAAEQNLRLLYSPAGGTFTLSAQAAPYTGALFGVKNVNASATAITVSGNGTNIVDPVAKTLGASFTFGGAFAGCDFLFDGTNWVDIAIT
jgi:hypothetical protein